MKLGYLRIETIGPARNNRDHTPPGSQQVGVIPRGVQVTHMPTGLIAICHHGRSQLQNRDTAMAMIEWGLAELGWTD